MINDFEKMYNTRTKMYDELVKECGARELKIKYLEEQLGCMKMLHEQAQEVIERRNDQLKEAREVILMEQYIINTFLIHIEDMNNGDDPSVQEKFLIDNANITLGKIREFLQKHKERG